MLPPPTPPRPAQPLLEQLLAEFQAAYPGIDFPPVPPKGELELGEVRQAAYFFS